MTPTTRAVTIARELLAYEAAGYDPAIPTPGLDDASAHDEDAHLLIARALVDMDERCRAMERVVEAARGIDARIGFSGGRTGVRFVGAAGIQRRELLDALLALDARGKEGA